MEMTDKQIRYREVASAWKNACYDVLSAFCEKHEIYEKHAYFVGDGLADSMPSLADFDGDMQANVEDMALDLDSNAPVGKFEEWYQYEMRTAMLGIRGINYRSWLMGAPRKSDEELTRLENAKQHIENLKEEFRKNIEEINSEY